jgi:hypothetical protein
MKSTRTMVATFGAFTGLMGIEHGVGEILQGSVPTPGLFIESWPGAEFFRILAGEPAFTLLPNLLAAGILACFFSALYLAWAVLYAERRPSGLILALLSVLMFLSGGGIFPPVLGLLIAAAASRLNQRIGMGYFRPTPIRRFLGGLWPWFYGACLLAWLAMFPGVPLLSYFFGIENDVMFFSILGGMFGFLVLSVVAGYAREANN